MAENTWRWHWGFFQPPKNWSFFTLSFLSLVGGTTLHLIIHFYGEIPPKQMTPETPDKNHAANGAELPRDNSHRTSHLLPIWSSQISHHLLPAVLRCQDTTTKTATPDLCDKANGSSSHAKIKKPLIHG